jgi:beta-glucosidase
MNTPFSVKFALLFLFVCAAVQQASPQNSIAPAPNGISPSSPQRIEDLIRQMTLEEKVRMCFGGTQPGVVQIPGVQRLGIPPMMGSDGPRGVTAAKDTSFPSGLGMAASWDPKLFQGVGAVIGKEARAAGVSIIFAPAVNIERDPLGGRFFEYLSEDPYLAGQLGAGMVRGIQSQRVASCVKHFTANNRDENRDWYMSNIDERTLHEIYLPAFEAAVKQGGAWAVMTAANGVNGHLAATNKYLITDNLKQSWGFQGLVLTDFNQARDTLAAADAGLDVGMPWGEWDTTPFGKPLMEAVQKGLVPESIVDDKVRRILRVMDHVGLLSGIDPHTGGAANTPESHAMALRAAEESIVLLKNEGSLLPLDSRKLRHVIVLGPNATRRQCLGLMGGSSGVEAEYEVTPLEGIEKRLAGKAEVEYLEVPEAGAFEVIEEHSWQPISDKRGLLAKYFNDGDALPAVERVDPKIDFTWEMRSPDPAKIHTDNFHAEYEGKLVPGETGYYTFRLSAEDEARLTVDGLPLIDIVGKGRVQSQTGTMHLDAGRTYNITVSYHAYLGDASLHLEWSLPSSPDQATTALNAIAGKLRAADAVIFIGGWGHGLDSEGQDRQNMDFPASQQAIIERLPAFNPRTVVVLIHGSPFTMDWLGQVPAVLDAFYPGMEGGTAIAEALLGEINPSGKLTFTWPKRLQDAPSRAIGTQDRDNVNYKEGVFVGYRYYDTRKVEPQFPFGYGLSYSTFRYRNFKVTQRGDTFAVSLDVSNTSARPGAEIVQLYVSPPDSSVPRPIHELKAFARVSLSAGQTRPVEMDVDRANLGYWDESTHGVKVDPGLYRFAVGESSRDILASAGIRLQK